MTIRRVGDNPAKDLETQKAVLLLTAFFSVVGCLILGLGFSFCVDYLTSTNWKTTQGVVITSNMTEFVDESDDGYDIDYRVKVVYRYDTPQGSFTHNRISTNDGLCIFGSCESFDHTYEYQSGAANRLAEYPVNQSITVLYDPQNHQNAVLKRDISQLGLILLGIGLITLVFFGAFFIDRAWRYKGKHGALTRT